MTIVQNEIVDYSVCVSLTPTSIRMCFILKIYICLPLYSPNYTDLAFS